MLKREVVLAALLAVAAALVTLGVAAWSAPAGLCAAGVMLAAWSWLVLGDVPEGKAPPE